MEKDNKFKAVVLGGGGIRGLLSLGSLHYYYEKGMYDPEYTEIYGGTSIGAVICLLLVCGYAPKEIFMEIYKMYYFFGISDNNSIWDIVTLMGLMSIRGFTDKIEILVKDKIGFIPTLKELYELKKKTFYVAVGNVSKTKGEYYNHVNNPDMGCVNAVKLSSNIPFIFQRVVYDGDYITDGGLIDNFPLQYIDDGIMKILAIVTIGDGVSQSDKEFVGYFYRLVMMPMKANTELRCQLAKPNTTLVKIYWDKTPFFSFTVESHLKMDMFIHGYKVSEYKEETEYIYLHELEAILPNKTSIFNEHSPKKICDFMYVRHESV